MNMYTDQILRVQVCLLLLVLRIVDEPTSTITYGLDLPLTEFWGQLSVSECPSVP